VLEKAAANVSVVRGILSPERAKAMSSRGRDEIDTGGGQAYSAVAMSLVFHACTPFVPTLRADVRLLEARLAADCADIPRVPF
jgi:coproporphyrinogen III oxidase